MNTLNTMKVLVLCLSMGSLFGQGAYKYSDFRYPEVKIRGLNTSFRLGGADNSYTFSNIFNNKTNSFTYNIQADYFQFANSPKIQKTDRISFANSYDRQKYSSTMNTEKTTAFNGYIAKTQVNRKYFDRSASFLNFNQKFFELNHHISGSIIRNNESQSATRYDNLKVTIPARLGFGRIEPMSDVFMAQFLMDDLLAEGLITEKFSQEKLFELAQLMSYIRNQRVFDFRRANIYQLTEIANWLEQNDINTSIKTFAIMNDNWSYNTLTQRKCGERISVGLAPWVEYFSQNKSDQTNYGLGIDIEYNEAQPLSQYSQSDITVILSQDYQQAYNEEHYFTKLTMAYRYAYNPNSRTIYSVGANAGIVTNNFSTFGTTVNLPVQVNYFINNRARLNGSVGFRFFQNNANIAIFRNQVSDFNVEVIDLTRSLVLGSPLLIGTGQSSYFYGNVSLQYALF